MATEIVKKGTVDFYWIIEGEGELSRIFHLAQNLR